jgi:hypothetical protein
MSAGGAGGGTEKDLNYYRKIGVTQYESWYTYFGTTSTLSTATLVASRLFAFPFIVPKTITLDRIAINVYTAGTGNARMGIYRNSESLGLYPDQLVLDSGEVSIASTGVKSVTINQQLTAGLYWLVIVSNGVPVVRGCAILGITPLLGYTSALGAEGAAVGLYVSFTYAALPTTFPSTPTKIVALPIPAVFVRVSA